MTKFPIVIASVLIFVSACTCSEKDVLRKKPFPKVNIPEAQVPVPPKKRTAVEKKIGIERHNRLAACRFGPKFRTIGSDFQGKCAGTVKVQGMYWRCTQMDRFASLNEKFLISLNQHAEEECQAFCEKRGCKYEYSPLEKCGLNSQAADAEYKG